MMFIKSFIKRAGFKPEKIKGALQSRVSKNLSSLEKAHGGRHTAGYRAAKGEADRAVAMPGKDKIKTKSDLDWAKKTLKNLGQKNLGKKG
jgi:hypothetical protein